MEPAGEGEVRADHVSEGLWRVCAGPRRRAGKREVQVACADGGGDAAIGRSQQVVCEAGCAGVRAGEEQLPAARSAESAVRVHVQPGRWAAVACRSAGTWAKVPRHKKAEVEMLAAKCVANCEMLQ